MIIEKIEFVSEKPYTQKVGKLFISSCSFDKKVDKYDSHKDIDQGYWLIYADKFLSEQEVCDIITDENLDRYL